MKNKHGGSHAEFYVDDEKSSGRKPELVVRRAYTRFGVGEKKSNNKEEGGEVGKDGKKEKGYGVALPLNMNRGYQVMCDTLDEIAIREYSKASKPYWKSLSKGGCTVYVALVLSRTGEEGELGTLW